MSVVYLECHISHIVFDKTVFKKRLRVLYNKLNQNSNGDYDKFFRVSVNKLWAINGKRANTDLNTCPDIKGIKAGLKDFLMKNTWPVFLIHTCQVQGLTDIDIYFIKEFISKRTLVM